MNKMLSFQFNKLSRRTRTCLIFCALFLSSMFFNSNVWAQSFNGYGTSTSPYQLSTSSDLDNFATAINGGNSNWVDKYWEVTTDISWNNASWPTIGINNNNNDRMFRGTFDGKGHTITLIGREFGTTAYSGFFGKTRDATIRNLNLVCPHLHGGDRTGALIGEANGSITIQNVHVRQDGFSVRRNVRGGGLIGACYSYNNTNSINIENCSYINTGTLWFEASGSSIDCGGFIGFISGGYGTARFKDCLVRIATISVGSDKAEDFGGFFGDVRSNLTMIRCVQSSGAIPNATGKCRGYLIGYKEANITTTAVYVVSGSLVYGGGTGTSGNVEVRTAWNATYVREKLERINDSGQTISDNLRGNERWSCSANGVFPMLKTNPHTAQGAYVVRVFGNHTTKVARMENYMGVDGAYYFTDADTPITVVSMESPGQNQRVGYTFDYAGYEPSVAPRYSDKIEKNNWILTPRVDGKVSSKIIEIPYPITVKSDFNQWESSNQVTLGWTYHNPDKLPGRFFVFRKETSQPASSWAQIQNPPTLSVVSGNNQSFSLTNTIEFNKIYHYLIAFVEGENPTAPSVTATPAHSATSSNVSTEPILDTWYVEATGGETAITIALTGIDRRLANGTFTIERKVNKGAYTSHSWLSAKTFNGATSYTITDDNNNSIPFSVCDGYQYRVTINAFNTTYVKETEVVRITGSTKFAATEPFKATKGEYANYVRLQWKVEKQPASQEIYRVFRRVANSNSAFIELETVTSNAATVYWSDNNALTGVYYEYKVTLYQVCSGEETDSESLTDLGFTQAFGTVSGRITYGTGSAVQGVDMLVKRNDLIDGETPYRSLKSIGGGQQFIWMDSGEVFNEAWLARNTSLQFWVYPQADNTGSSIIGYFCYHAIYLDKVEGGYRVRYSPEYRGDSFGTDASSAVIPANRFSHVTLTLSGTELAIYTVNDQDPDSIYITKNTGTYTRPVEASLPVINRGIRLGDYLKGNIDDLRFWNRALGEEEILRDYNRRLVGNENGLKGYWTFDEGVAGCAFDMSREGTVYNGHHATTMTLVHDTRIPDEKYQLGLRGLSDANGNYQINGIPYQGEGTSYSIVPVMGIHQFNPTEQLRYVSAQSMVHNSTDFTDISSFPVSGKVFYANSNYPVDEVLISIDGQPANKDGKAIMTDPYGEFTVDVPIGAHFITVSKQGHSFANGGRFPANPLEKHNFQTSMSGFEFEDITTVRLMGRVAGGQPETDIPIGFGLSNANIGQATITLRTVNDNFRLNLTDKDSITVATIGGKQSETTFKRSVAGSVIEIKTNPETGEFLAVLPPVAYNLTGVKTIEFEDTGADGEERDFAYSQMTFNMNPSLSQTAEYTDPETKRTYTFDYNDLVKITRYNDPVIEVADKRAKPGAFGDSIYIYTNNTTGNKEYIPLYSVENDGTVAYALDVPVFSQKTLEYQWEVTAYEEYVNRDDSDPDNWETDHVPLEGAIVEINNALASMRVDIDLTTPDLDATLSEETDTQLTLDSLGRRNYTFQVGFPNINGNHRLVAKLTLNQNGKAYTWEKTGILFGQLPTDGSNFVTMGPDEVDIVLNDPPGSYSYAYIAKGSSYTKTTTRTNIRTVTETENMTVHIGVETKTGAGVGFIVLNNVDSKFDVEVNGMQENWDGHNWERHKTTTFNQQISTSSDPFYVGSMADVYIGNSTNIVYGKMRQLALYPKEQDVTGSIINVGDYNLFTKEILTADQQLGTMFTYTQTSILENHIPNIKALRNQLIEPVTTLPTQGSIYFGESKAKYFSLLPASHKDFGEPEQYYVFFSPNAEDFERVDEVQDYNTWIMNWEDRIYDNEKAKIDLFEKRESLSNKKDPAIFENLSFDAGVGIEKSLEVNYTSLEIFQNGFNAEGSLGGTSGFKVNGVGVVFSGSIGGKHEQGNENIDTNSNTITFGYVLAESGGDFDRVEDAISVDVYGPSSEDMQNIVQGTDTLSHLSGFTFRTRAGQTSCPHEPADSTLFYMDNQGKPRLLNYGTFKIENPEIYINNTKTATAENIPAGREATFTLQLQNNSEANLNVTYQLMVAPESNPKGLILSVDGEPLVAPRPIRINYGTEAIKTLKVRQSSLDVLDYEDIEIRLSSICDLDHYSLATISVHFTPSSSPVTLRASSTLANRAAMESSGKINFTISEYDRTFRNFGMIRLQYRKSTDEIWNTVKEYVNDTDLFKLEGEREMINGYTISYEYNYDENTPSDGEYIFRALAVSLIGYEEAYSSSEEIRIVKDVRPPMILGNPSPVNGILNMGDEISITFNEDIQTGMINPATASTYFSITGILNADIRMEPTSGLVFDGNTNRASTEMPIYAGGSFAIESWIQLPQYKEGTLFAYGEGSNYFTLGFDATGHAVVTTGGDNITSTGTVEASEVWKYIGISFNAEDNTVSVYALEGDKNLELIKDRKINGVPPSQGKLHVGNNAAGNAGFKGAVSFLHFYNAARDIVDASISKYETKSGNEPNLIGLWELEEGEGSVAKDKARSRSLVLNTSWYVYPTGKSLAFNGTNQYAAFSSGTFPFRSFDDFTWEFWFKGGAQNAATLLSVGSIAQIGFNANKELILTAGANTQVLATTNLLDDQWHHFALSVKREGTIRAYVDGKITASFNSAIFVGTVGAGEYYLAAKMTPPNSFSQYFRGNIDEVRVWGATLSTDAILLEKNKKLRGTEAGLKAYFPFEAYDKKDQIIQVYESLKDMVTGNTISYNTGTISDMGAPMQDARPVKNVPFSVTPSDRKIVLNITEEPYRLEGVTLKITAKDILDMHNNPSGAYSWIAFVNQNALKWQTDGVDIAMGEGDIKSFKATITNRGGENTAYYIEDLPEWLTVNAPNGNLSPLSNRELTFTVSQAVNVGSYEATVVLRGDNNVREILPVTLKVSRQGPDWSVNPSDFTSSMNIIGQVKIAGIFHENTESLLAAFIGDLCVGVTSSIYVDANNAYFTFADIYGNFNIGTNEHNNQPLTFKLWDASTGRIYPKIETSVANIRFSPSQLIGSVGNPVIFDALDINAQQIAMKKGWSWISTNLLSDNPAIFTQMKSSLADAGLLIKDQNNYVQYVQQPQPNWIGSLTTVSEKSMYLVNTNRDFRLELEGKSADPSKSPIDIKPEWTWIGYIPSFTLPVQDALAGMNAQVGDIIKGQTGFATYLGTGWAGTLTTMQEGRGYMYYSNSNTMQQLIYPSKAPQKAPTLRSAATEANVASHWQADPGRYASTMTMTAIVINSGEEMRSSQIEIAAFSNSECRGSALLQYEASVDKYIGFLMIYGEGNENITLKVYDHAANKEYNANNAPINFTANAFFGIPDFYIVALGTTTGMDETNWNAVVIYPNPVNVYLYINHPWDKIDKVEVIDLSGRTVLCETVFEGRSINLSSILQGYYLLKITHKGQIIVKKFVKK